MVLINFVCFVVMPLQTTARKKQKPVDLTIQTRKKPKIVAEKDKKTPIVTISIANDLTKMVAEKDFINENEAFFKTLGNL